MMAHGRSSAMIGYGRVNVTMASRKSYCGGTKVPATKLPALASLVTIDAARLTAVTRAGAEASDNDRPNCLSISLAGGRPFMSSGDDDRAHCVTKEPERADHGQIAKRQ